MIACLIFSLLGFGSSACVNINTPEIASKLNVSYDSDCYRDTKSKYECCSHFMLDDRCMDSYTNCVMYKEYIIDDIKDSCDGSGEEMFNLSYSDKCHDFALELDPMCCDNMLLPECTGWYTDCHLHESGLNNETACSIPTKYTNTYCSEYVKHIDDTCCVDFDENCVGIYAWCLANNPNQTSVLDLFLGPRIGYIIGDSHKIINDVEMLELCAALCIQASNCHSINYIEEYGYCHLNSHVTGDIGVEFIYDSNSVYYAKMYKMPVSDTLCNIKYNYWIGDGMCDRNGGYNTEECNYDGGDCCQETCVYNGYFGCGFRSLDCKDPSVLNTTTTSITSTSVTSTTTSVTSTSVTSRTLTSITSTSVTPTSVTSTSVTSATSTTATSTSVTSTTATSTSITTTGDCHNGKVFSTCGSPCEATCLYPNPRCIEVCATGCFCPSNKPIFDIKGNRCVSLDKCTTTSTTGTATSTTGTATSTSGTSTSTSGTSTYTTGTSTSTTGTSTSTTGTRTSRTGTSTPNTSSEYIDDYGEAYSSSGTRNIFKNKNIIYAIFIPILCIFISIIGIVLFRKYQRQQIINNGNNVIMENRQDVSFENPVYNRDIEGENELYQESPGEETSTYSDVNNNYTVSTYDTEIECQSNI